MTLGNSDNNHIVLFRGDMQAICNIKVVLKGRKKTGNIGHSCINWGLNHLIVYALRCLVEAEPCGCIHMCDLPNTTWRPKRSGTSCDPICMHPNATTLFPAISGVLSLRIGPTAVERRMREAVLIFSDILKRPRAWKGLGRALQSFRVELSSGFLPDGFELSTSSQIPKILTSAGYRIRLSTAPITAR